MADHVLWEKEKAELVKEIERLTKVTEEDKANISNLMAAVKRNNTIIKQLHDRHANDDRRICTLEHEIHDLRGRLEYDPNSPPFPLGQGARPTVRTRSTTQHRQPSQIPDSLPCTPPLCPPPDGMNEDERIPKMQQVAPPEEQHATTEESQQYLHTGEVGAHGGNIENTMTGTFADLDRQIEIGTRALHELQPKIEEQNAIVKGLAERTSQIPLPFPCRTPPLCTPPLSSCSAPDGMSKDDGNPKMQQVALVGQEHKKKKPTILTPRGHGHPWWRCTQHNDTFPRNHCPFGTSGRHRNG